MIIKTFTCIECPIGCLLEIGLEDNKIAYIKGNSCPRGKVYAENEATCPKRVLTSTVRTENGTLISVKTNNPIKKEEMFAVMKKINAIKCKEPVKIGDVLYKNITDGVDLIATSNS